MTPYQAPINTLLPLGRPDLEEWLDYGQFGLTADHVAELTRLATDKGLYYSDSDSPEVYAPIHAWRALGQLGAASTVPDLLGLIGPDDDNDWPLEEYPRVFEAMGLAAVPALTAWLGDGTRDTSSRWAAADGLKRIAERHPELRSEVIEALERPLAAEARWDPVLNGAVISSLTDLKAVEAAPVMQAAFAAGRVDESIAGGWPEVAYRLGVGPPPPPRRRPASWRPPAGDNPRARAEVRKARRKREKNARKRNRKQH
jgi:hypothetical protein